MMSKVVLFVPTYNRASYLEKLYKSLLVQDYKNFELLIIDDGSVDNTKSMVESWIKSDRIKIKYVYQENQGKHFAYNRAIKEADGDLFFDVDSDDYLKPNALSTVVKEWESISDKENYAGIQYLCVLENEELVGTKFKRKEGSNFEFRYIDKIKGDKGIVYQLSKLKNVSLPEIKNEIVPESILHNRITRNLKVRTMNEALKVVCYLPDGLTLQSKSSRSSAESRVILFNEMNYFDLNTQLYFFVNSRYVKYALLKGDSAKHVLDGAIKRRSYFLVVFALGWISYKKKLLKKAS